MNQPVCHGAIMICSCGVTPSALVIVPSVVFHTTPLPMANVSHCRPLVNIPPFGVCSAPANPSALPVKACAVLPAGTWTAIAPTVLVEGIPVLANTATLACTYGGVIAIVSPSPPAVYLTIAASRP